MGPTMISVTESWGVKQSLSAPYRSVSVLLAPRGTAGRELLRVANTEKSSPSSAEAGRRVRIVDDSPMTMS